MMAAHSKSTPAAQLPSEFGHEGPVGLLAYQRAVGATDHLPRGELDSAMQGLFGEVGSLLTVAKKQRRDATPIPATRQLSVKSAVMFCGTSPSLLTARVSIYLS